ncbi:cytidylate kinase [Lapidilactobacillus dextrinicus DSM 20335]|uniref:Cytidylate kinase n=1 Tax=Lapidilactobacillus dextrinicus DSM 20335 TaxID=1423738 RepID=A0A0R2BIM9_9LACO|nr:(d)CMP kinase [Lapidilactobacillus dextrinicus]KRM79185.1 cytidylate kinase [Lapidilactobacillus dextrinicus DSM 20335]QFG46970.1 (d)CMP kinase [Lapidilactobacillus dextrinicus]
MQIAIDGPSSAGKSTVAKKVAQKLGFIYCDTGAMYRAATVLAKENGIDYGDEEQILAKLSQSEISFKPSEKGQLVFLNDEDVTLAIRTPEITNNVSQVSALPKIREELVRQQRKIAGDHDIVMDGRDIGTTVLPNAEVKVFLIASASERARRRYDENIQKGIMTPLAKLQEEIEIRDYKDSHREISPLTKATDASEIDSTNLSIQQVVDKIVELANNAR